MSVLHVDVIEAFAQGKYLLRSDRYVCSLALSPTGRLVNHHPGVRKRPPLPGGASGKQYRSHGARLADAQGVNGVRDVLHGVIDSEARRDRAAGTVNVHVDLFSRRTRGERKKTRDSGVSGLWLPTGQARGEGKSKSSARALVTYRLARSLGLQEQELRDNEGRHLVVHGPVDEDDALLEEPRVQIESPFSALGPFQNHGHHVKGPRLGLRCHEAPAKAADQLLRQLRQVSHRRSVLLPPRV